MKLKDIILSESLPQSQIHRTYNDFIEDDEIPENSIQFDHEGRIVSDQLSVLKFIQFLLKEYEYLPEGKDNKKLNDKEESKKKKTKKRKKRIKTMNQFTHGSSNYPSSIGNSFDYYL